MSEPTASELDRAVTALLPFVRRWGLSLNPEDVTEMAYAALVHARSEESPEQIVDVVEAQIDQHAQRARLLLDAMRAAQEESSAGRRKGRRSA